MLDLKTWCRSRQALAVGVISLCAALGACSGVPEPRSINNASDRAVLEFLDHNNDGIMDPYEVTDQLMQLEMEVTSPRMSVEVFVEQLAAKTRRDAEEAEELLVGLDANQDGEVLLSELDGMMLGLAEMIDENADGILALGEFQAFDVADAEFISDADVEEEVDDLFRDLDLDGDQHLVRGEVSEERQSRLFGSDRNHDGRVSKTELLQYWTLNNQFASFQITGTTAVMSGVIGADTPAKVLRLIVEFPDVRTIEMSVVPGSIDDEANLRAARYIRKHGFTMILRADSVVASGGTDFFLAGKTRLVEAGARLGIHSWAMPGLEGKDVPRDDPQHRLYLDFYEEMDIPADFYWRTLEAAPARNIHWMTRQEIEQYNVATSSSVR